MWPFLMIIGKKKIWVINQPNYYLSPLLMLMYGPDGVAISFHMGIIFLGTGWTGLN